MSEITSFETKRQQVIDDAERLDLPAEAVEAWEESMKPTTDAEINHRRFEVHEFIEYLRYIATQDASFQMTAGQIWKMFSLGVRDGMHWSEVADEIGLPQNLDWY